MKNLILISIVSIFGLSACVKSHTMAEKQISDRSLSCHETADRIGELNGIKELSLKEKGWSGKNVAAGLFFWPAIIGNEMNANKTIEAVDKRKSVLTDLYTSNDCNDEIPEYTIEQIKEKINNNDVKELQS